MFEGLHAAEKVAMVLGIALFVLMLVVLVLQLIRRQSPTVPGILMILPVLMILWPTIGSIEYADGKLKVQHLTDKVAENPQDTVAQRQLATAIRKIEGRVPVFRSGLIDRARAGLHLGEAAILNLQAGRQLSRSDRIPAASIDSIGIAIDSKVAAVDTKGLTSSGLKQYQELRNWQKIVRTEILARVVAKDPSDTAAARRLEVKKTDLNNLDLTPDQQTATEKLRIR